MTFPDDSSKCDHLGPHISPVLNDYAGEREEFVHPDEQVGPFNSHIPQLNTSQGTLQHHPHTSQQLHNVLSPIYTLPIEVLSHIFQQLVVILGDSEYPFRWYRACLSHALILRSVSVHFRHVARGTPELWEGVAIDIPNRKAIGNSLSQLRHCLALASSVNVSIIEQLDKEDAYLAIDTLLTSDTMPKIKAFELAHSTEATSIWIKKLKGSSFTMLDALSLRPSPSLNFDFGSLKTVTRLSLYGTSVHDTIIAPPSLRYLTTTNISLQTMISLLYQSPNLVEFCTVIDPLFFEGGIQFNEPLTLNYLKRLTFRGINVAATPSSLHNLRLPSLETLELEYDNENQFIGSILLCQNVSATLRILKIDVAFGAKVEKDELYQLWKLPFPNLRELEFISTSEVDLESTICMLESRADECSNTESRCLPSLTNLTLYWSPKLAPCYLLDLLKKLKIGDASYFHLELKCFDFPQDLSPDLREELRSTIGSRRIEISWNGNKILRLPRGVKGSFEGTNGD